jgi:hypothetical protein
MAKKFENRIKKDPDQMRIKGNGTGVYLSPSVANDLADNTNGLSLKRSKYIRQTYHILEVQRMAIALMSAHEGFDKSEIVRSALDNYIPKKYTQMAMIESPE